MTTLLRAIGAACTLAALPAVAADARDVPPPPATYVLDEADWLDAADEARLSQALLHFERESSNQIVVAVFRTLDGEDLADFSQRVAEGWRIGQADRDNGVLLAVFVEERLVDIEVGYGLEPVVTDAVAARIRSEILAPAFREGRYADGLFAAVDALKSAARGEFRGAGEAQSDRFPLRALVLMILAFVILSTILGRLGATHGPVIFGPPGWGNSGRVFRSSRGGGFGGGGFRGGSFRGGGGSFGGGGARGSW